MNIKEQSRTLNHDDVLLAEMEYYDGTHHNVAVTGYDNLEKWIKNNNVARVLNIRQVTFDKYVKKRRRQLFLYRLTDRLKKSISSSLVSNPPGTKLLFIVDFLFRPATVKLTFKPLIADWRYEYFEALQQGRKYKARWIQIRYRFRFVFTFIMAIGLSKAFSFFKQIIK